MPRQLPAAGDSRPPHPRFRRPPWHGDAGRLLAFPVPGTVGDEGVRDLSSMVDTVGTRGSVPARVDTASCRCPSPMFTDMRTNGVRNCGLRPGLLGKGHDPYTHKVMGSRRSRHARSHSRSLAITRNVDEPYQVAAALEGALPPIPMASRPISNSSAASSLSMARGPGQRIDPTISHRGGAK